MVKTNRFLLAPCLRLQMIRQFGRRVSVRTIQRRLLANGYWSRHPAWCFKLNFDHRRHRREWGRRHTVWDLRQWRHCIVSDESWFSLHHSDSLVRVHRRQGERLIDACVQRNDGNRGSSVMVWSAIIMGGGVSWSWWMEPWTSIGTSRSWGIKCCHGRWGCLDITLVSSESRHIPNWACLGSNVSQDPRHGWPPFHNSWTKQCSPPGVGYNKSEDPGREHAMSCQGSSGR